MNKFHKAELEYLEIAENLINKCKEMNEIDETSAGDSLFGYSFEYKDSEGNTIEITLKKNK